MADTEKSGAMVLHEEGVTAPTLALPTPSPQSIFVVLKQLQSGDSGKDKGSLMAFSEANEMVKSSTGIHPTSSTFADSNNVQSENLPADARCKGITASLDNNSMWNEFYRCQTEMILTKQGRRMFPYCRFRLSGMEPFQSYLLAMDIVPVDTYRYRWSGKGWETNGKAETHVSRLFVHPESPATGLHWMQYPVSFYRLKLCNNMEQEDHVILHSMHRYLPRLHIIPADKDSKNIQVDRPNVVTLCFSQTEFFAVTAYQNLRITQLKIDYNPFAKGFRDDAVNARSSKAKNGMSTEEAESELKISREMTTLNNLKTLFMKRNAAVKVNKDQNIPSPTNGERKAINGDAPVVDTNVQSLCNKKRPSSLAFSDFIKGAHVKVKRLSLENIKKNGVVLQASTTCPSEKNEVMDISSKTESIPQVVKDESVVGDRCKSIETSSKTELKIDENKTEIDEHKANKVTLLSSDQNNEKGMETLSSQNTEAKSEENTKKALLHKRPERVPLPLLAQFLKQRKSKTRPTTPKPDVPSSSLDSEKSCEPLLTPENSSGLSSIPCVTTNSDSKPILTSLFEKVKLSSTTDASNITSESTALSLSATASPVPAETQLSVRFPPSLKCSDPLNAPNTTSPSRYDYDPSPDKISSVFHYADAVFMPDLGNTLRSQSDISSFPTHDTCLQTTPEINTDSDKLVVPSVTTSVFGVPSSTDISIIPFQQLTSIPDVAESDSMSDCLLDSSKGSCTELFLKVPQNNLFTNEESLSLPLDDPSSPAFSLPSPTPSSPDPFPPNLFCERPVPTRKTLDSFPERLLECTASSSPDIFPLGLFNDRPVPPKRILNFGAAITMDGTLTSKELLSPSVPSVLEHPRETVHLFCQSPCSDRRGPLNEVQSAVSCEISDHISPEPTKKSSHGSTFKKSKAKQKKTGKLKFIEDNEVFEGPIPVPMQPSLENVEGQLFVSFMTKKALEIHLGDDANMEVGQKYTENPDGARYENVEEKIEELEKMLLRDLKVMRHRQVIHPVLQEVGLKLNLLDLSLEIDLQYLGVQLPIPPSVLSPEGSSASSQVRFVSRTGKTTDFTKIKGWRDKFSGSGSNVEVMSSTETGQKNLSAFCSDMLDEYLESEGKLIDERAATLSQADDTPVAYQLPTKSTSYVRTLDSVLKKKVPATLSTTPNKVKPTLKTKEENKSKKHLKSGTEKHIKPVFSVNKPALTLKTTAKQQKNKSKNKKEYKSLSPQKPALETAAHVVSNKTTMVEVCGSTLSSCAAGRTTGLPKTLVKLMDVEDGAVWEGKHRTFITEERAAIALATLVTAEGVSKGNPEANRIIRRRAPPCLNVFCRLGCVCASLVHLRRHHHCGKPQCMLGCSCLRRKVVALKTPKQEQSATDESEPQGISEENKAKWKKKNKKRKAYVLTDPEAAPEPAKRVSTLWDRKGDCSDSEVLFCPPTPRAPSPALLSRELQNDLEIFFSSSKQKRVEERHFNITEDNMENRLTCARSRPFSLMCRAKQNMSDQHHISQVSTQDIEEGELLPLNLSGPAKRLEIISECSWASTDTRNHIMRVVCEHMAQDCLKQSFWIGKYFIQPVSKTVQDNEDGSVDTYKVIISQPAEKKKEDEKVTENKAELKKDLEKSEVKGLPFLSGCCPAGLLKAEKKAPDAPGRIMVNGKSYPQAKLELGKMGALHPANRLAAYITGRICPVSQSGPNVVATATVTKAPITSVPVSTVSKETTVTSTSASAAKPLITSVVTKPPVGKVFTQFVVNHINSQNLTNTSTSQLQPSIPKIVIPSSMLMIGREAGAPGVALSPVKADLVTQVPKPSDSTGSASSPTLSKVQPPANTIIANAPSLPLGGSGGSPTTTVSSPGLTTAGKKTVYITVMSRSAGLTSSGPKLQSPKPVIQTRSPQTQNQKVLLQVVKTSDGNTLYRNPNGQLLQLVPLSQIKTIKPNLLSQGQPTFIRLPAPPAVNTKKPQGGSATTVKSFSLIPQAQTKPVVTVPVSTSSSTSSKPVTLTSSNAVSLSSIPSTLKVVPGFLGQSGTCTLRILPPHPVQNTEIITPTSSPATPQSGFTLVKHGSSTLYNQDSTKSETISVRSVSKEETVRNQSEMDPSKQNRCDGSEQIADNVSKLPSSVGSTSKPSHFPGDSLAETGKEADPKVTEKDFDIAPVSEEEEIDSDITELTDDSDLYSDDDRDDTFSLSGSDKVEKMLDTDGLRSETKDFAEVVVDIETIEESAEENSIAKFRASALRRNLHLRNLKHIHDERLEVKVRRVRLERLRRRTIKDSFLKLQAVLGKSSMDFETSKMRILTMAKKEIDSLVKQDERLVKKKQRLQFKRQRYLQTLSQLCDKSTDSISKKLNEIIAKQKVLETQSKDKEMKSQLHEAMPKLKPKLADLESKQNKLKDVPKPTYSPSKPMDLSIKKQKSLEKNKNTSAASPVNLDSSKNTPKTQDKEKDGTSKSSQPSFNSSPQKKHVSVPSPIKYSSVLRERTRPNILSRSSSQVIQGSPVKEPFLTNVCIPQVLPLMNTMVPCSQIITINNPLQPIGITPVGTQQSSTGVASVSIVPAVTHPVGVENPLSLLQPQFIKITNSPVNINTQVDSTKLPNITNVISLVPPAENLVIPQKLAKDTSVVQAQPTFVTAPVENRQKRLDAKTLDLEGRAVVDELQFKAFPKQPVKGDKSASVTSSNQEALDKKNQDDSSDPEDENLLSLLDELVLLSQQLSNEDEDQRIVVPGEVQAGSDKQADPERDDDRALSPLFLTLDEDLMSPDSKDEIDIPPKVDDLVKVIFGSDSPSISSESGVAQSTNVQSPQDPASSVKGDPPTPPPLLHMKAACEVASGQSANEGTSVAWRPMPKLVPLGLKPQDAVLNKVTGSPVSKTDSNEEDVHRTQM